MEWVKFKVTRRTGSENCGPYGVAELTKDEGVDDHAHVGGGNHRRAIGPLEAGQRDN